MALPDPRPSTYEPQLGPATDEAHEPVLVAVRVTGGAPRETLYGTPGVIDAARRIDIDRWGHNEFLAPYQQGERTFARWIRQGQAYADALRDEVADLPVDHPARYAVRYWAAWVDRQMNAALANWVRRRTLVAA